MDVDSGASIVYDLQMFSERRWFKGCASVRKTAVPGSKSDITLPHGYISHMRLPHAGCTIALTGRGKKKSFNQKEIIYLFDYLFIKRPHHRLLPVTKTRPNQILNLPKTARLHI
jgi:hypothetical protein